MGSGPKYDKASAALDAAHKACLKYNDTPLGMSHGPFSGVNVALGIIAELERDNIAMTREMLWLSAALWVALDGKEILVRDDTPRDVECFSVEGGGRMVRRANR